MLLHAIYRDAVCMRLGAFTVVLATTVGLLCGLGGTPAQAAPTVTAAMVAQENRVVALVNQHRARAGCHPLRIDLRLVRAARGHSQDMAARGYFAHDSRTGVTPWQRIMAKGYPRVSMAENIAAGQRTPAEVVGAWMRSPGHRRNILNCSMRAVGVGLAYGGPYRVYWTQDFGSR